MSLLGVLGMDKPIQLNFVELMQADQAPRVTSIAAGLPAKARAISHITQGQLFRRNNFVAMQRGERNLSGWGQPEVIVCTTKNFFSKFGKLP